MTQALSNHYFRYLRDLYSVELQIISLIPEIAGQISSRQIGALLDEARHRRDLLELIAAEHDISAAGDDCLSMRNLARQARSEMARTADSVSREAMALAACERIRRHTLSGYKVVALLAEQLGFGVDSTRLNMLLTSGFTEMEREVLPVSRNHRSASAREFLPA